MSTHAQPVPPSRPEVVVRDLGDSRHLSRSDRAFEEFIATLETTGRAGAAQILTVRGRTICATIDVDRHRELLYDHLVETLATRPELLGELRAALDDEDLVEG